MWTLNKLHYSFLLVFIFWISFNIQGQPLKENTKSDYLFPINPGKINALSGTMGELRTTHFHTGLDVRTDGTIGLPVYSSNDGYISRVFVSPGGYGHALYITHNDGNTTVYAHLSRFAEPIASLVLTEQYRKKSFSLNKYFTKGTFPVTKGDVIAYSGNTGSSAGPHLHWDLRDPYQRPLNPLKYGFSEIRDTKPPKVIRIAFKCLDDKARINGHYGRFSFPVTQQNGKYTLQQKVHLKGYIGIELLSYDELDDSRFRCGITDFVVKVDHKIYYDLELTRLSFLHQRSIYTFYNYPEFIDSGNKYYKLYIDDGNDLPVYQDNSLDGAIHFTGTSSLIEVILKDSYGNTSALEYTTAEEENNNTGSYQSPRPFIVLDNILMIGADRFELTKGDQIDFYNGKGKTSISSAFEQNNQLTFLHDLRKNIPEYMVIGDKKTNFNIKAPIYPEKDYTWYDQEMDIQFFKNSLFDTLYLRTQYYKDSVKGLEIFEIGDINVPLKSSINITLKPTSGSYNNKYAVYAMGNNGHFSYYGGTWQNDKITFKTGYFGSFTIIEDTEPPKISVTQFSGSKVSFQISDDLSGVSSYRAEIDGSWLLMHYDPKTNRIWSERLDKTKPLSGDFTLTVTDNAQNKSTFTRKLE